MTKLESLPLLICLDCDVPSSDTASPLLVELFVGLTVIHCVVYHNHILGRLETRSVYRLSSRPAFIIFIMLTRTNILPQVVYCYKGYKDNKDLEGDNIKWVTLSLGSFLFPHRMLTYQITRFSNGEITDILESPAKGKWANVTAVSNVGVDLQSLTDTDILLLALSPQNATKKEPFVVITNLNTHKKTCRT